MIEERVEGVSIFQLSNLYATLKIESFYNLIKIIKANAHFVIFDQLNIDSDPCIVWTV